MPPEMPPEMPKICQALDLHIKTLRQHLFLNTDARLRSLTYLEMKRTIQENQMLERFTQTLRGWKIALEGNGVQPPDQLPGPLQALLSLVDQGTPRPPPCFHFRCWELKLRQAIGLPLERLTIPGLTPEELVLRLVSEVHAVSQQPVPPLSWTDLLPGDRNDTGMLPPEGIRETPSHHPSMTRPSPIQTTTITSSETTPMMESTHSTSSHSLLRKRLASPLRVVPSKVRTLEKQ